MSSPCLSELFSIEINPTYKRCPPLPFLLSASSSQSCCISLQFNKKGIRVVGSKTNLEQREKAKCGCILFKIKSTMV